VHSTHLQRTPGTAVFPHSSKETTPLALRAQVEHNHVLHERVIIVSGRTANVPHIPWDQRVTVDNLGDASDGIVHIAAEFGFQDPTDFPALLRYAYERQIPGLEGDLDPAHASYFLSRIILRRTRRPGMSTWRKMLFVAMAHNAADQAEFLCLPVDRTISMGARLDL
jgi:KUP system potassium uptake protein